MPEEERTELESNFKYVKDIYIDSEVVDKLWVEDPNSGYAKPAKGMLGTLILKECEERVVLLMGSDCGTEDFLMEEEVISNGSDAISLDDETMMRSMALREELDDDGLVFKLSGSEDHKEENDLCQDASKEADIAKPMAASAVGESKNREDNSIAFDQADKLQQRENEIMICSGYAGHEGFNSIQQHSGSIPYSGSISLRSTSSTASAQSFAFPMIPIGKIMTVLQEAPELLENCSSAYFERKFTFDLFDELVKQIGTGVEQ